MAITCLLSSVLTGVDIVCLDWLQEGGALLVWRPACLCQTEMGFECSEREASHTMRPSPLSGADLGHGHDVDLILSANKGPGSPSSLHRSTPYYGREADWAFAFPIAQLPQLT